MTVLLLAVIYLAFVSLGLPDSVLGSAWPAMYDAFSVSLSAAGIISMITSGCTILSSLFSERLIRRLRIRTILTVSILLTSGAMFAFSFAGAFWVLCICAVPYGLGAGAVDASLNHYVAAHYSARHMNWLHCFWGVGTILSPYIVSLALTHGGWQSGYRTVGFIQLGIALVVMASAPLWKKQAAVSGSGKESGSVIGIRGALRIPGVPPALFGFFCYCAAEATCMLWASSYLIRTHGFSTEKAAAFGSLFFIGLTAGRFLAGFLPAKLQDTVRILVGAAVAVSGAVLLCIPNLPASAVIAGLIVIGFGCAPVYPSIIHNTPIQFGQENAKAVIGIQMASAYVGSTFVPPLFGLIAERVGTNYMPLFAGLFLALMALSILLSVQLTRSSASEL
ncbi:MAG: MFS transporter [Clostridia bacterium]|nr:MFS transporter [Clostridia bacterium]